MGLRLTPLALAAALGLALAPTVRAGAEESAVPTPFVVQDLAGSPQDLGAALGRGQAVALVFWQTWCKACAREAPEVAAAARVHADAITFVGVISGPDRYVDDAEVARVAAAWGYAFPQVRDRDLDLARRFHVAATPTIVVLAPDGRVAYRGRVPPDDWAALVPPAGG